MVRYCPICGKTDEQAAFHGELCMDCARERVPQLPTVRVRVCPKCSAVIDKARKKKEMTFEDEASRMLKIKQLNPKYSEDYKTVEYDTPAGRINQDIVVLTEKEMCAECARKGSQYFEAIIQLRGDEGKMEIMTERLIKRISSRSFIPKIEELKEGIDIYCGSRNEAIAALNSQQLGFLRTEKLAGEKDGKRLYRTTLLVRL